MGNRWLTTEERFWGRVEKRGPQDCWLWTGGVVFSKTTPYGKLMDGGRLDLAHRVAYRLLVGEIPDGHHVHHSCRESLCVNPAHLEAVSPADHGRRHTSPRCKRGHVKVERHGRLVCLECRRAASRRYEKTRKRTR